MGRRRDQNHNRNPKPNFVWLGKLGLPAGAELLGPNDQGRLRPSSTDQKHDHDDDTKKQPTVDQVVNTRRDGVA